MATTCPAPWSRHSRPACRRILGETCFNAVAHRLIEHNPSKRADLNRYAASFSDFLDDWTSTRATFSDYRYLGDLARLEWHCHFEQRSLSTGQLERLDALMAVNTPGPAGRRLIAKSLIGWPAAVAIAALLAVIVLLPPGSVDDVPMTERIAMEVARNHVKLKPLDVETDNMDGIRRYFTDLEFIPVKSQLLASSNLELLGGRYCSIQSVPAAQLRVSALDKPGMQTLYQSEYRKDVFGPLPVLENGGVPVEVNVKGFTVRIWVEKGLLFALTEEAELEPIDPGE